jgi:hypothetical protein
MGMQPVWIARREEKSLGAVGFRQLAKITDGLDRRGSEGEA